MRSGACCDSSGRTRAPSLDSVGATLLGISARPPDRRCSEPDSWREPSLAARRPSLADVRARTHVCHPCCVDTTPCLPQGSVAGRPHTVSVCTPEPPHGFFPCSFRTTAFAAREPLPGAAVATFALLRV